MEAFTPPVALLPVVISLYLISIVEISLPPTMHDVVPLYTSAALTFVPVSLKSARCVFRKRGSALLENICTPRLPLVVIHMGVRVALHPIAVSSFVP